MTRIPRVSMAVMIVIAAMEASPAVASPQMLAKAAEKALPAGDCQYCHASALPTKDKQKAKTVDMEWLKSYPGGKDQK